jgi:chemotaxis protein CheD
VIRSETSKFGKPLYIIYPGDYFATKEECVIGTVTGSCVAVCLYDTSRKIGGMCHFIVPGAMGTEGIVSDEIARKGVASMEYLMGEIVKVGGDRRYLTAKIFGAGYMGSERVDDQKLTSSNIRFIHEYFTLENIPVARNDLGGNFRRKIYFSPHDEVVYRQILKNNEESSEFIRLEKEYIDQEFRNKERTGRVVLFE